MFARIPAASTVHLQDPCTARQGASSHATPHAHHAPIYPRFPVPPRANVPPHYPRTAAAAAYSGTDPSYYGESANLAAPLAASSGNIFSAARRWIVEWNL